MLVIPNFLSLEQNQKLLAFIISQQQFFQSSSTFTGQGRRSLVLYHSITSVVDAVTEILSDVSSNLGIELSYPVQVECQVTAHNDGDYYGPHDDSGSPDCANRKISYVYYLYQEPKAFTGGELLVQDERAIVPLNNQLILFPSGKLHEVTKVHCASKDFADSRFSVNGWVRG